MKKKLKVSDIVFMNVVAILSVRWFATAGQYGAASVILWLLAAFLFFVPFSLICAEFGAKYPDTKGGITSWIKNLLGPKWAYYSSWFYFANNLFFYPTLLTFGAIALAYALNPAIATNKIYIAVFVIIAFWIGTLINIYGAKASIIFVKFGGFFGNILPIIIVFILAFVSVVFLKKPIPTSYALHSFLPHFTSHNLLFLSTLTFAMSGVIITSVFVSQIENPKKNFPKAIFISVIVITLAYILGTIALNLVISPAKLGPASGILQVIMLVTNAMNIGYIGSVICVGILFGTLASVIIWIIGSIKMFVEGNDENYIPKFFKKNNKYDMPINALILQAIVITFIMIFTTFLPSVKNIYEILVIMSAILGFLSYLVLLWAYIKMKLSEKENENNIFSVPGKKVGGMIVAIISIFSVLVTLITPIFAPVGNVLEFELWIIGGPILFVFIAYINNCAAIWFVKINFKGSATKRSNLVITLAIVKMGVARIFDKIGNK